MRRLWLQHSWSVAEFTLKNFATPIAFFWMFEARGAKAAIALAIAVTLLQLVMHAVLKLKISPFFLTASGFTVVFGGMDLLIETPKFYRLEPFAQNSLLGAVFLGTVLMKRPIVIWFAESLPEQLRPKLDAGAQIYLRKLTLVWAIYFFLKSGLFLYLALKVDLGRLVILRAVIGGASLALMFGGELLYRKKLRRVRL